MRYLILLLFIPFGMSLNSCATFQTATANTPQWVGQQIRPSQLFINGNVSFSGKLSDGSTYSVFKDDIVDLDSGYYYNQMMTDWGHIYDGGNNWNRPRDRIVLRSPKLGYIYLNPNKRIAVYIYPTGTYAEFKVSIVDEEGKEVPVKDWSILKENQSYHIHPTKGPMVGGF